MEGSAGGSGASAGAGARPGAGAGGAGARSRSGAAGGGAGDLDEVLGALADPTRRSLFERLIASGPDTATHLADGLPVTRQAVVKHLQVLAHAGLLTSAREGREVRYRAEPGALDDAVDWMVRSGAAWDRRLERLRGRVSAGAGTGPGPGAPAPADDGL
jgi:DNA-binding transcriptional ArsR family regulator